MGFQMFEKESNEIFMIRKIEFEILINNLFYCQNKFIYNELLLGEYEI